MPRTAHVREKAVKRGFPQGETVHELVRADGVFFKTWNYRSGYTSKFGQLQPAPLFIASTASVVSMAVGPNWITSGLVMVAFAFALGVIIMIAWVYRRDDRRAHSR